jgi:hypothetical protein
MAVVSILACGALPATAAEPAPATQDGLELRSQTKSRLVYAKPGANLSAYGRVAILDCYVEFEKDWQKDYNESRVGLDSRVTDQDVERMKTGLAAEFKKVFTTELQDKGGYQVVNVAAPDVLVLRPALINVEVNAPDLMSADLRRTVVRSAGQMTLYLELWDPTTNTLLARIVDAQADDSGFAKEANRVTNVTAADQILRDWASELRKHLDAARGKSET